MAADFVAKTGYNLALDFIVLDDPPEGLLNILYMDKCNISSTLS